VVAQLPFSGGFAEACRVVADTGQRISRHAKQGLNDLADLLDALTEAAQGMRPGELIREIVQRTDYIAWRRDGLSDPNWKERQGVLEDLAANADTFRSTASYLQQVAVAAAQDNAQGGKRVRISTVHAAKGLEFDVVFTPALEEGVLPNMAALQQDYGLAEERRIAHVAWTRARKELVISYALLRWNQPAEASRFLVDAELLDAELRGSTAPMHQRRRQQMQGASKQAGIQVSGFHRMPRRKR
jgi:DNA helicase-2/ATP-dependent DNA helicase PcrA